jgi:hypothetical protein
MATDESEDFSTVSYYARQGQLRHLQSACSAGMKRRGDDPFMVFWSAYASIQEGAVQEGIRALQVRELASE